MRSYWPLLELYKIYLTLIRWILKYTVNYLRETWPISRFSLLKSISSTVSRAANLPATAASSWPFTQGSDCCDFSSGGVQGLGQKGSGGCWYGYTTQVVWLAKGWIKEIRILSGEKAKGQREDITDVCLVSNFFLELALCLGIWKK